MKSLCYVLAINVVFSAANILDARNSSDESGGQSRKLKHTISRIFSIPNNQARAAHNERYYNQLMKLLTGASLGTSEMEETKSNSELTDLDILLENELKGAYPDSNSQDETHLQTNVQTDGTGVNIPNTKETKLNADTLTDILRNLKASNVSNLGHNPIRNGKLFIYYNENKKSSENPIEKTENDDNSQLSFENIMRIEEAIHNLFTHHEVPEDIYYTIKRRVNVDAKDRIKNLITAFVKYIASKGQLNSDIKNRVKMFIADNNIDIDLVKLLMTLNDNVGAPDLNTESRTDAVADVMNSIFEHSDLVQPEMSVQKSDVTTILDSALINEPVSDKANNVPAVNLSLNPEISVDPTVTSKSFNTLRDIVLNPQEIVTIKEENSKPFIPSEINTIVNLNSVDTNENFNENISEGLKSGSDDLFRTVVDNNDLNLAKSLQTNKNLFNAVKIGIQDNKTPGQPINGNSEDILNHLKTQLNHSIKTKIDFETIKTILNGAIGNSPYLQQVDSNVPVFSNIPVEEYLNYNNGKPILIYVVFPKSEKSKISNSEKETALEINASEKDNSVLEDINAIIRNYVESVKTKPESSGESDLNSILHLIQEEIANTKKEQGIKETNPLTPNKSSPNMILDIIYKIKNSYPRYRPNETQNTKKEMVEDILNHFYDTKDSRNKLNNDNNILNIIEGINNQETSTDQQKKQNDIIKQLLILFPNIVIKPGHDATRNGNEKDVFEKLKELIFKSKHSHDNNAKSITDDPNFLIILQKILNENNNLNEIDKMSEQEIIYRAAEELIARMKYLQIELEKRNIPRLTQRNIIEKEVQKGLLKISKDSVASCVKRANKLIELSIGKVLRKSLE